jgi:cyclase
MSSLFRALTVGAFAASASALSAQGADWSGPPKFSWVEVVPGVYATIEPRELALSILVHGNSVFVVNDSDVFAVDANRTPAAASETIELLRQATSKPVRNLLITHFHGDHLLGTQAFAEAFPGLNIISSDSTRVDMRRTLADAFPKRPPDFYTKAAAQYDSLFDAGVDASGRPFTPARRAMFDITRKQFRNYYIVQAPHIKFFPPTTTFQGRMTLWSGTREIEMFSFRGDTRGDAIAWLPNERVLITGDALVEPVPYASSRTPSVWLESLRTMRALHPLHIVPGHGNVQNDTEYLDRVIAMLDAGLQEVRKTVAAGLTVEETKKRVTLSDWKAKFAHGDPAIEDRWDDFLEPFIENAFAEASVKK